MSFHSPKINGTCISVNPKSFIAKKQFGVKLRTMTMIGDRILARLKEMGKTQKWLADQLGVSPARIQNYVKNTRTPDTQMLDRIAAVMHTDAEWLNGADEQLSELFEAVLAKLFALSGQPEQMGGAFARVALEALRVARSLPPEGDVRLRARLAAAAAWQTRAEQLR